MLGDGQAQPGTTGAARTAAVDAVEAFGQARDVFGFDANPGILHRKFGACGRHSPDQRDGAAAGGVAHRIRYQIGQRADQFRLGTQQIALTFTIEHDAVTSARQSLSITMQLVDQAGHVDRLVWRRRRRLD